MYDCDHVSQFRDQGFAVVRGVFDPHDLAALRCAFDRVYCRAMSHRASFRHQNVLYRLAEDPALGRIVRYVQWPAYFDRVLARYRTDPRMLEILAPLLGSDLKQIINQMHWKPAGASQVEFGFHQDIGSRRPRSAYRAPERSYIQTGIAIDRHDAMSGAMKVLPGSHRLGELTFARERATMDRPLDDADLATFGLDPSALVDLDLAPGDVALWHLHLIHGSGANHAAHDRRFYINGYVIAENCDRGEWAFRDGRPCPLGTPQLVHYDELHERPEPHYV